MGGLFTGVATALPELIITLTAVRQGALTLIQVSILVMGLLDREKHGITGIGWESFLIIVLFIGGYLLIFYS